MKQEIISWKNENITFWFVRSTKKIYRILNIKHSLILVCTITGSVLISAFALTVGIPVRIASSAAGFKICAITAGINKYKSILMEKA